VWGVYAVLWVEFGPRPAGPADEWSANLRLLARDPATACDALPSTRGAVLSGPGCPRIGRRRVGITATGSVSGRDSRIALVAAAARIPTAGAS
jgi:hypothetical protein